ncbi:MAG: CapA family protein [Bacteroidota bacterium]
MKYITHFVCLLLSIQLIAQSPQNWNWSNKADDNDEVSIILLGDTNIQNRENPSDAFQSILPTLQAADLRFCNLEGPLAGTSSDPNEADVPHKFSWKHSDPKMVEAFVAGGFDVVGVANNVTYPYTALQRSLAVLDENNIQPVGGGDNLAEAHAPVIIEKKGTKIGFLQYACTVFPYEHAAKVNQPGIAELKVITSYRPPKSLDKPGKATVVQAIPQPASLRRMQEDIRALAAKADIVIVSYHWGISVTPTPVDYQRAVGRAAIEAGADVILGHGPHTVQTVETWQNRPIFYSAGNSVFDWWKARKTLDGLMVRLVAKNKKLQEISFVPLRRDEGNHAILYPPNSETGKAILTNICKDKHPYRARLRSTDTEVKVFDATYEEKIPILEKMWEIDGLQKPESVVYDAEQKVLYASNLGGDQPKDGFISKISLDGKIQTLKWIGNLNNPKGLTMHNGFLYANDQHEVLKIDPNSGKIIQKYPITGAVFLNDLDVDTDGTIYTVDSDGQQVFRIKSGRAKVFWQDRQRGRPNGILVEKDRILLTTTRSSQLIALDKTLRLTDVLQADIGTGDGIEPMGNEDYLLTDFQGRIFYFSSMENLHTLLDTRGNNHTADLEYLQSEKMIIVPGHKTNKMQAFRLKMP